VINLGCLIWIISGDPGWWGLREAYEHLTCFFGPNMPSIQGLQQEFVQGKPPAQALVQASPAGTRREGSDTPGWTLYTVPEGAEAQTLVFDVQADKEQLVFYPRVSGAESSVEVAVLTGGKPRPLARLTGKPGIWTPVSAQWTIPMTCFERDRPLRLQVTLTGPWAQLWTKDGAAFF